MTQHLKAGSVEGLVEKLEAADGGSRELDALIFRAMGEPLPDDFLGYGIKLTWQSDGTATLPVGDMQVRYDPPAYTTSLDAALALAERVGFGDCFDIQVRPGTARVTWFNGKKGHWHVTDDQATPALALCIAILKARLSLTLEGEG